MKLKSMLKFALAALALSAGVSAFAQVQLSTGGDPVTWAAFAATINAGKVANPATELPADNQYAVALANAQKAYWGEDNDGKIGDGTENGAKAESTIAATALANAKSAYETANNNLTSWQAQRSTLESQRNTLSSSTVRVPAGWLSTAYSNANKVKAAYSTSGSTTVTAFYIYDYDSSDDYGILYLSFADKKPSDEINGKVFETITAPALYKLCVTDASTIDELYVYLGDDYSEEDPNLYVNVPAKPRTLMTNVSAALQSLVNSGTYSENPNQEEINNLNEQISDLNDNINDLTVTLYKGTTDAEGNTTFVKDANGKTKLTILNEVYSAAQTTASEKKEAAETAWNDVLTAQTNYNNALDDFNADAFAAYQNVTLTGNVNAATTITADYSGRINANGYVITSPANAALFNNFTGRLSNAAIVGTFADDYVGAVFNKVAVWTGSTGRYYDDNGATTTAATIGALGFAARDNFGVNLTAETPVLVSYKVDTDKASKVYWVTTYSFTNQNGTKTYANATANNFVNATSKDGLVATNEFVKSETTDFPSTINNVFYQDENGYQCPAAVITDKVNYYCPAEINVAKLNYARQFTSGLNTACLPFAVSAAESDEAVYNSAIDYVATFDQQAGTNFWFKQKDKSVAVAANTPIMINATSAFSFGDMESVVLPKTVNQIVNDEGNTEEASYSAGTVIKTTPASFNTAPGFNVFGLAAASKEFQMAASTASFGAFRMVVISAYTGPSNAPRKIIVFDEDGVEVDSTDAIVTVEAESSSVNVGSVQGQIVFTSEADYGTVQIYTIDGKAAATADVMEGVTTVDVPQGVYIVMGKKVLVK